MKSYVLGLVVVVLIFGYIENKFEIQTQIELQQQKQKQDQYFKYWDNLIFNNNVYESN